MYLTDVLVTRARDDFVNQACVLHHGCDSYSVKGFKIQNKYLIIYFMNSSKTNAFCDFLKGKL